MDIQISQIIFQIINFGVVLGALTYLMYKPVLKTLKQRAQKIEESQKAADALIQEKDELNKMKLKVLSQSKKDANDLIVEAQAQVKEKKTEMLKTAKKEVEAFVAEEKAKWEDEKARMVKQMQQEISDAVFLISEKVLGEAVDKKAHTKLIDQGIKEVVQAL